MTYSSSLSDDPTPLILDTSVLINLHASRHGEHILAAVPNDVLVPEIVAWELEHETSKLNGEHQFLRELVAAGKVKVALLTEHEYEAYATIVAGRTSLGDGEAATIAVAAARNLKAVIDERKGRQKAEIECAGRIPGWSLDLFRHPRILATLGDDTATEALYLALRDGRMRIHDDHCDHVVGLIGLERALECNSLPGYKMRREKWDKKLLSANGTTRTMNKA